MFFFRYYSWREDRKQSEREKAWGQERSMSQDSNLNFLPKFLPKLFILLNNRNRK